MYINQRVHDALQVLYEEGLKHLKEEYKEGADRHECIGMAIAEELSPRAVAQIAYSAWEDCNAHSACSVLNWMFNLYPTSYYSGDIKALQYLINREQVLKTVWNWDKVDHDTARFRVTVQAEELKP